MSLDLKDLRKRVEVLFKDIDSALNRFQNIVSTIENGLSVINTREDSKIAYETALEIVQDSNEHLQNKIEELQNHKFPLDPKNVQETFRHLASTRLTFEGTAPGYAENWLKLELAVEVRDVEVALMHVEREEVEDAIKVAKLDPIKKRIGHLILVTYGLLRGFEETGGNIGGGEQTRDQEEIDELITEIGLAF
jgi:ABC-type dipeptide/oligopeptide/nickel transport system ATPase subunit